MAKFKTRARAVDMLGRQQIAGVPNAISELFKNAHDAYADHVEVDYFRSDNLFILRDDGLGMTHEDFENRWLTIGTESKISSLKGIIKPPIDPTKPPRPITGEKGIGRLAIAVIGPQVLVLTRAKREDGLHDLVTAFLHWRLFEAPGVNLDQIEIPVRTFPGGTLPANEDIQKMVGLVHQNVLELQKDGYLENKFADEIAQELMGFNLNLEDTSNFLGRPHLLDQGHGTHFYILPTREDLAEDLELIENKSKESRIRKLLLGFSNTMIPNHAPPALSTAFRYWQNDEQDSEIIGEGEFFTPEEFISADHHFQGRFDEFGQFIGDISVYGEETHNHVIPWLKGANKASACGPFQINIAYVQGNARESKLPPEEWARIISKLNSLGGLYIYKDGIRILPYGDNDVDFLNIEKRRTQGIGYYFFSYRRMFGAIELTQAENGKLAEKAGREGFQENRAFRDFKDILENFFIQTAADFFRQGGEQTATFEETRNELNRLKNAREQQEKESQKKRGKFELELEAFWRKANSGEVQSEVDGIIQSLLQDIERASQRQDEIALLNAELYANRKLAEIRNKYKVERPDGTGLTKQLTHDWNAYAMEVDRLEKEVFSEVQTHIQSIITKTSNELKFALDRKQRIELLVNEIVVDSRNNVRKDIQSTQNTFTHLLGRFNELAQEMTDALMQTSQVVERELDDFDIVSKSSEEIEAHRHRWETQVDEEARKYSEVLKHIQAQLENINWYRDENGYLIGNAEITAALEEEVLALRERTDADVELAQLGMALNIISHEFSNTIKAIRNGLRRLRTWANENPQLTSVYQEINDSFTHLDGYLTLFTPLNRRLYRSTVEIKGSSIVSYLENLFKERMKRHDVSLITSQTFRESTIIGYPSTFYPVFVNLVDNSIFWLKDHPLPREVTLDAREGSFIVSDNGPGIPRRDQGAVFELGFTRKPSGRGMGLYISREVLKKAGFELQLDINDSKRGTAFIIMPVGSSI